MCFTQYYENNIIDDTMWIQLQWADELCAGRWKYYYKELLINLYYSTTCLIVSWLSLTILLFD
jgi:hypothetical protein